jgi:hypothetical protein
VVESVVPSVEIIAVQQIIQASFKELPLIKTMNSALLIRRKNLK